MDTDAELSAEVLRARKRFLSTGSFDEQSVRPDIRDSWRRSTSLRVHPDRVRLHFVREPRTNSPLVVAAAPVLRRIAEDVAGQPICVILTSADGVVLERVCGDAAILETLDAVRLAPGYSYAEQFVGTSGIGTALELAEPTYIQGGEHYVETLGRLSCAASPIRDPMSGRVVGAIDLTTWACQSSPLLYVLTKSAGKQIEDRMRTLASESETALLEAYLQHCRRFPLGVLAIGGDVVLMNRYLRQTLDGIEQMALLEQASDFRCSAVAGSAFVATLPSGRTARINAVHQSPGRGCGDNFVFHVGIAVEAAGPPSIGRHVGPVRIPGLAGASSSWRHSIEQVERCYRNRNWVVLEGEPGSGRSRLAQAVAQHLRPDQIVRVFQDRDLIGAKALTELQAETDGEDFAVVIADLDSIDHDSVEQLASVLRSRAGHGWVAATMRSGSNAAAMEPLLSLFTHTVPVPALRHRTEDLDELVPFLLRDLTHGADVRLSREAMSQLRKLPWPGNVAQLRKVLAATVATQRSGVIGVDQLPPECRSLSRRRLSQMEALERDAIVRSLLENGGNKAEAAEALGMSRATIYRKIKEYGVA